MRVMEVLSLSAPSKPSSNTDFYFFFFFFLDGKQDMNLLHANLFVFAPLPLAFAL